MQETATAQTEIASKLAEAAAKQPVIHQIIPEPKVFAGKLRVYDPDEAIPADRAQQETNVVKAAVEILPEEVQPCDPAPKKSTNQSVGEAVTPIVSIDLQSASINTKATQARLLPETTPVVPKKPATDVVFQTTTQTSKPAAETLRDTNQRIADYLSSKDRPNRRRSAA